MDLQGRIRRVVRRFAPYSDILDYIVVSAVIILLVGGWYFSQEVPGLQTDHIIWIIASISGLAAYYQMRHSDLRLPPTVRPAFEWDGEAQAVDFGLKNYGQGPALEFQLVVDIGGSTVLELPPGKVPLQIEEDSVLGLFKSNRIPAEKTLNIEHLAEYPDETEIEFYYSFTSDQGVREPTHHNGIRDSETYYKNYLVKKNHRNPRSVTVGEVRRRLAGK